MINVKTIAIGLAISFATLIPSAASAGDFVECHIHAPKGRYNLEVYRVGDRFPTRLDYSIEINGELDYEWFDLPTGMYFVRATLQSNPRVTGQGSAVPIVSWFWWLQWLPDCWVRN